MVVESFHASVANCTVAGARRAEHQAVRAHLAGVDLSKKVEEIVLGAQVSWVSNGCHEEAKRDAWA